MSSLLIAAAMSVAGIAIPKTAAAIAPANVSRVAVGAVPGAARRSRRMATNQRNARQPSMNSQPPSSTQFESALYQARIVASVA